jgi:hypothetical protein
LRVEGCRLSAPSLGCQFNFFERIYKMRVGCVGNDSGFRVQGLGYRVQGLGYWVQGLGYRVQGLGYRDYTLSAWGFRM